MQESGIPSCSQRMTNWFLSPCGFFPPLLSVCHFRVSFPEVTSSVISPSLCAGSQDCSASSAALWLRQLCLLAAPACQAPRLCAGHPASLGSTARQMLSSCSGGAPGSWLGPPRSRGLPGQGGRLPQVLRRPCLPSPRLRGLAVSAQACPQPWEVTRRGWFQSPRKATKPEPSTHEKERGEETQAPTAAVSGVTGLVPGPGGDETRREGQGVSPQQE